LLLGFGLVQAAFAVGAFGGVSYKTVTIDGLDIFYREAGNPKNPTILLLHGFPTSSHMFRDLIPELADEFHPVAPDYPGKNDEIFPAAGAYPYKRDIKNLEFHLLDTGHFALEEDGQFIADTMREFLHKQAAK
jgi:pimeloyl-ACP methyl ester carboxylesterase